MDCCLYHFLPELVFWWIISDLESRWIFCFCSYDFFLTSMISVPISICTYIYKAPNNRYTAGIAGFFRTHGKPSS